MFKFRAFWLLIALFWAISSVIHSKGAILPKIDVDGRIEIVGDYTDGQEFEIVLRFTLRPTGRAYENYQQHLLELKKRAEQGDLIAVQELDYYTDLIDVAYVTNESTIEFLSSRVWRGKLEPNNEVIFRVRARVKEKKTTLLAGYVDLGCQIDKSNPNSTSWGLMSASLISKVLHFDDIVNDGETEDTVYISKDSTCVLLKNCQIPL